MANVRNILQVKGSNIYFTHPEDTVYNALAIMCEKNLGAILVLDEGKFTGIFTERDYARKVILKGKASKETLIKEIMSEHPLTVTPDTSIEECMQVMAGSSIRHLPVLQGDNLVGLVSMGDLVKHIIKEQQFIIKNLEHYIAGQ